MHNTKLLPFFTLTLGFQCFNQQLVDTSFPHGRGGSPMVDVSTQCSEDSTSYPDRTRHSVVLGCFEHWLWPIHRAMLHWLRKLMGLIVLVASDNSTVVSYINKQGGTWSIQLSVRTQRLLLMCQAIQIVLRARHILRRLNVLADILLRPAQMSGTQWSLHPSVF